MRIRKPAGLGPVGIAIITTIGLFGGYYIWKPCFEQLIAADRAKYINQKNGRMMKTTAGKIGLVVITTSIIFGSLVGIKFKLMPYYKLHQLQESKKYADFIYHRESK